MARANDMFYDLTVPFFLQVNKTDRCSCSCTVTMQQNQPESTSCSSSALSSVSGTEQRGQFNQRR